MGLLEFKRDEYSQNGEDGILHHIFDLIGAEAMTCCEFGAWDGLHLSNTRKLLLAGWSGLLIEANFKRYEKLKQNYSMIPRVKCVCGLVDSSKFIEDALADNGFSSLDLLSIDIDGLDYYMMQGLLIRPRLICIEVNAGHSPESKEPLPRSLVENIGQRLDVFCQTGKTLGYRLIGFNGNAFFLRNDITHKLLPEIDPVSAYLEYVDGISKAEKRWMYLVNRGLVTPYHQFMNDYLTSDRLGLSSVDISRAYAQSIIYRSRGIVRKFINLFCK